MSYTAVYWRGRRALTALFILTAAAVGASLLAAEPAAATVVFEDALDGATKGKQEGGEFVAGGGWRATQPFDRLMIELPRAARDGSAFEIDIKNLDVPKQRDAGENFLFGLWEQADGEGGGDQNLPQRDCFYLYAGTKYPQFKLKFHTHGFGWFEKTYAPIASFDPQHTYRWRVEWQDRLVKVSLDGQLVTSWESPAFDPLDRCKLVCIGANPGSERTRREALRGPIFSNLRVTTTRPPDPTAPADLIITEQTATGARLQWVAPTEQQGARQYQVWRNGKLAQTTAATSFTDRNLADGEYSYVIKAVSASGKASPASNAIKVRVANRSLSARRAAHIKIDGKPDEPEWHLARRAFQPLKGSANEAVQFDALWDDQYLYLSARVTDAKLVKDSPEPTDDDAIEILLDGNNSGAPFAYSRRQFDDADRQFVKRWNDAGLYVKQGQQPGQYRADGQYEGVRHAWAKVAGGYAIELAVSWASLGLQPGEVKSIGFDLRGYDDDDGQEADAIVVWQSMHLNALITSAYGDLTLSPAAKGRAAARRNR